MGRLEHASLDSKVDRRLGAQFNQNINRILSQFRVAEQRGLDWEKAVDSIGDALCVVDESAKIIRVNRVFANRLGLEIQDLIGQNVSKYICDQRDRACPINQAVKANEKFEQSIEKSRLGCQLHLIVTPVMSPSKQRRFVVVVQETREVSDSLVGLREILNAQSTPSFIADPKSRKILEVNAKFIETFSLAAPGIYVDDLLSSDRTLERMKLEQNIALGGKETFSFCIGHAEHREFETNSVMRRDQKSQPRASLVIMNPVIPTQHKEEHLKNLLSPDSNLAAFATIPIGEIN
jgi:PAS domain S-box-containing protein